MAAYIIVNVDVHNPGPYAEYVKQSPASIAAYGGRFIVRGGHAELLEGSWQPKRVVVLEFPSLAAAKAWWSCEEYRDAKALRQANSTADMIVVEGVDPSR